MPLTTIYLIIAGLIGLLVGLLFASLFSGKESRGARKNLPPEDMLKEGFADEARLWYSPAGKKIATEMDGEFYRDYQTLTREQKKKVQRLLTLWQGWAGAEVTPVEQPKPEEVAPVREPIFAYEPVEPEPVEPESVVAAIPDDDDSFLVDLQKLESAEEVLPFSEEILSTVVTPKKQSITEQISEILDELLSKSNLKDQNVKLMENAEHGVDVFVGLEKFSGVDAVPYPQIRELIRSAVVIWEKQAEAQQRLNKQ